ncbi:hypothetical protein FCK90_08305 [Kocuria coralli]|uniref:M50 family metallopeptidase n=1 Tax=Kocuria coralli TaxID=1461025 RepID=A0A5J5KZ50_9MICC|nr:hypothetical protein [Kocuria coralli]KAA9394116.1 hypothetical protein FCK90_08305 [Kocuria coralli]
MDLDIVASLFVIAVVLGVLWASVAIHELGHFLAGLAVGVPREAMSVRLRNPPHVALLAPDDGGTWLSPDHPDYAETFRGYNPSERAAWVFIAGGFLVETSAVVAVAGLVHDLGTLPVVLTGASTALVVFYLAADLVLSTVRKRPCGDASAMWRIAPSYTAITVMTMLAIRLGVILLVLPV